MNNGASLYSFLLNRRETHKVVDMVTLFQHQTKRKYLNKMLLCNLALYTQSMHEAVSSKFRQRFFVFDFPSFDYFISVVCVLFM